MGIIVFNARKKRTESSLHPPYSGSFRYDAVLRATSVIGLMPNPMRGDWERYVHNGYLDDILRKPVKLVHLRGMLLR